MASQILAYTTKELSKKTWPDFARLFSQKEWLGFLLVHAFSSALLLAQKQETAFQA
jgi:hypothetical protein